LTEDLIIEISNKEAELRIICQEMERFRNKFVQETIILARRWFEETARIYVLKYPDISLSMSEQSLAQMKNMVKKLIGDADRIVQIIMSDRTAWWNLEPRKNESLRLYEQLGDEKVGNKFPETVDRLVRQVLGELGVVLEKFGFKVTVNAANAAAYPEYWFEKTEKRSGVRPFYPHLLEWSEPMKSMLAQYDVLYRSGVGLFVEIERLRDEKKKRETNQRWDSV
jgi:hypothetical protein